MQNKKSSSIDYIFLTITLLLVIAGLAAFFSSALGILARDEGKFYNIIVSQFALGLGGGIIFLFICMRIPTLFWRNNAGIIFIFTLVLATLVFVPGIGFAHGGAKRWINVFGISFQPVEFLKIGFVMYFAAWLSWAKKKVESPLYGLLPLFVMLALTASVLLFEPDTKSLILMALTGLSLLFISGAPWKHLVGLFGIAVAFFIIVALATPYLRDRIDTFLHPSKDPTGSSYQIQQSLIGIGSGRLFGRGFGQSIQKFSYLPEPQGDSIFAVIGEEFGFIGSVFVVILYLLFAMRGLWIARRAPDLFSGLLVAGIVIILSFQSFLNIASITGLFPLTGVPLVFMSQGGTSLLFSLGAIGIILRVSAMRKRA